MVLGLVVVVVVVVAVRERPVGRSVELLLEGGRSVLVAGRPERLRDLHVRLQGGGEELLGYPRFVGNGSRWVGDGSPRLPKPYMRPPVPPGTAMFAGIPATESSIR